jgi:periplasmic protein CpxP/Spy
MKKQLITLASIALFAATSGAAIAAPGHDGAGHVGKRDLHRGAGMHGGGDPGRMVEHLSRRLGLDESQRQTLEDAAAALKPEMAAVRERAEANRQAMRELDPDASDFDSKLDELAREKGDIETQQTLLHGRLRSEIHAVLTPEQLQQLSTESKKMRARFGKREARSPQTGD